MKRGLPVEKIARTRLHEVLHVMIDEDFAHLLHQAGMLQQLSWLDSARLKFSKPQDPPEIRLRRMMEKLGPTFIKLGQLLATRPDLLPPSYITELERLQDRAPVVAWGTMKTHIEKHLGKKITDVFKSFNRTPLAAASIAQVYKAQLKNGKWVAVKVQRPQVAEQMHIDLDVLMYIATTLQKHSKTLRKYHLTGIVREMQRWTHDELDFTREQEHMLAFADMVKDNDHIFVPRVYTQYTTKQLLVMEYVEGIHLTDMDTVKKKHLDLRPLLKESFQFTLSSVFDHGIFHADPHPGNFIITTAKEDGQQVIHLTVLDFGIVGHFDDWLRQYAAKLLLAAVQQDADTMTQLIMDISLGDDEDVDVDAVKKRVKMSLRELHQSLGNVRIGILFQQALNAAIEAQVQVPVEFVLFAKTIITAEGVAANFDPHFNVTKECEPFIRSFVKREMREELSKENLAVRFYTMTKVIGDMPVLLHRILQKFEDGHIKLHIRDTDIKSLSNNMELASRRFSYALLTTACIIAGAITQEFRVLFFSQLFSVSALFYILAAWFGLLLLKSMHKNY